MSTLEGPFEDCSPLYSIPHGLPAPAGRPLTAEAPHRTSCHFGRSREQCRDLFDLGLERETHTPVFPATLPARVRLGWRAAGAWLYLVQGLGASRHSPGWAAKERKWCWRLPGVCDNASLVAVWCGSQLSDFSKVSQPP